MLYRCPQKNKTKQTPPKPHNISCSPATCQGAAGAGCFPRAGETAGEGNNEGNPRRDFSAPQDKRSKLSPTKATRVNQQSRQARRPKASPRTSQANKPARHTGRCATPKRPGWALGACWHAHGPDVAVGPDSLDGWFLVSNMRCKIVWSVVRRRPAPTPPLRAYSGRADVGRTERSRPLLPVACSAETVSRATSRLSSFTSGQRRRQLEN